MNPVSQSKALVLLILMTICLVAISSNGGYADGHKGAKHGINKAYEQAFQKDDHGNETTGEIAASMFAVANLPVALSIILKTLAHFDPPGLNFRDTLTRFNRRQKKYLMKLHYWLNPIALGIALTHFGLSTCRSTAFPEWGLGVVLVIFLLGVTAKFKLSPASMRQRVFRFHTSPVLLIAAISILFIGHTMVD